MDVICSMDARVLWVACTELRARPRILPGQMRLFAACPASPLGMADASPLRQGCLDVTMGVRAASWTWLTNLAWRS